MSSSSSDVPARQLNVIESTSGSPAPRDPAGAATANPLSMRFVGPGVITRIVLASMITQANDDAGAMAMLQPAVLDGSAAMTFVLNNAASTAVSTTGKVDDNSDLAVRGNVARAKYGVTGSGIKIGILSDSFNVLGGMAADVKAGNLGSNTKILKEGPAGSHDEGRAMAELIHKIAPGAQILFYSATGSSTAFATGVAALQAAGANVIVDDVAYLDEPFFQDGSAEQVAVEKAISKGVDYFTSASNEGTNYYQHGFTPMQVLLTGLPGIWTVNNFGVDGAKKPYITLTIPRNSTAQIDLQWDQAFATIGSGHGATSSLAMALYTSTGQLVGTAGTLLLGKNPEQLLSFTNTTTTTQFRLVVISSGKTPPPDQFKFIPYGSAVITDPLAGLGSGSVAGHELVAGANTVGAVNYANTPAFGGTDTVEPYSAVGSGQILFDSNGNRLAQPINEQKVTFLAPDGSMTSVYAPFDGTSAAAPDAAAVAALVLQADPYLTTGQVTNILEQSAIAAQGPAGSTGAGLIQADTAVQLALAMLHQT